MEQIAEHSTVRKWGSKIGNLQTCADIITTYLVWLNCLMQWNNKDVAVQYTHSYLSFIQNLGIENDCSIRVFPEYMCILLKYFNGDLYI